MIITNFCACLQAAASPCSLLGHATILEILNYSSSRKIYKQEANSNCTILWSYVYMYLGSLLALAKCNTANMT